MPQLWRLAALCCARRYDKARRCPAPSLFVRTHLAFSAHNTVSEEASHRETLEVWGVTERYFSAQAAPACSRPAGAQAKVRNAVAVAAVAPGYVQAGAENHGARDDPARSIGAWDEDSATCRPSGTREWRLQPEAPCMSLGVLTLARASSVH